MEAKTILEVLLQEMENNRHCSFHLFHNLIVPLVGDLYGAQAMMKFLKQTTGIRVPCGSIKIVEYKLLDNLTANDVIFELETYNIVQICVDQGATFKGTPQQFADEFFSNVSLQSLEAWAKMNQNCVVVSYDDGSVNKVFDYTREE